MTYTLMPGKPAPSRSDQETLSQIREMLTDDTKPKPRRAAVPVNKARTPRPEPAKPAPKKADRFPPLPAQDPLVLMDPVKPSRKDRRRNLMPRRKHVLVVSVAALLVLQPLWVLIPVGVTVLLVVLAFMLGGGERIWKGVLLGLADMAKTDPVRADKMRTGLDRLAMRWDGFLDRLPAGRFDGLYMPDFQALEIEGMDQEEIARNRLARLQRGA